jgi:branched-chain amino acid transport system substrate-binding protein
MERFRSLTCMTVAVALMVASCGGGDGGGGDAGPVATETSTTETSTTETSTTETTVTATTVDTTASVSDPAAVFPSLGPPTGEPMRVGLVNTEGTPGLDFPDIRLAISGAVDYLNEHGGYGGRPIDLEICTAAGSPETSQACAQELTGGGVELVLLGLDLFPDYATYTAAGVPVIGVLPILPGDYTANARFLTGGNATVMAAAAGVAQQHFGAISVGIISADNPGGNSSRDALTAALDAIGIDYVSVTGGNTETDAGFLGLMSRAASGDPDLIVSLYDDAGCIGTIRGRATLGLDIPVLTTGICASSAVIDQVGDEAIGWNFMGVATPSDDPAALILGDIMGPVLGVAPDEVDSTSLGLGGLGLFMTMSLAVYANQLVADGADVTGPALFDLLDTADDLTLWPGGAPVKCGAAPAYPSVCSFTFPVAEYLPGGEVRTIPGLDAFSALEFLP